MDSITTRTLLTARDISKGYASRVVLVDVGLELGRGHTYVLTGDNGTGKSTLLRIICGLERADTGTIEFNGSRISLRTYPDALRRDIVYVHQHPYLFHTTIAENIGYGLKARGVARGVRADVVRNAMEWAGIDRLAHVPPHKLSGGEKQRVALARARVLTPKLYLLDEPTTNLDRVARTQIFDLIASLREDGVTVLLASHDREVIALPQIKRLHLEEGRISETNATADPPA